MNTEPVTIEMIEQETGIEKTSAQKILEHFQEFLKEAGELEAEAKKIQITDALQVDDMKKAREIRLKLKGVRTNAEKVKTKLKERVLIEGNFIQGIYNAVVRATKPLEEDLEAQEKFVQLQEEARLQRLLEARNEALRPFVPDISVYSLRDMTDEAFDQLLSNAKEAHDLKIKAENEARIAREKKEKEDREERERLRIENEKLKKEADEKERIRQLEIIEQKRKDDEMAKKIKVLEDQKKEAEKFEVQKIKNRIEPIIAPWETVGDKKEKTITVEKKVVDSIAELTNYLYRDEERDFMENGSPKKGHIFNHISIIMEWLGTLDK